MTREHESMKEQKRTERTKPDYNAFSLEKPVKVKNEAEGEIPPCVYIKGFPEFPVNNQVTLMGGELDNSEHFMCPASCSWSLFCLHFCLKRFYS